MSAPRWSRGPDTLGANGSFYGDYAFEGRSVTDDAGRVYFLETPIGFGSAQTFLRLDPPYTEWFTMWSFAASSSPTGIKGASEFMELQAQGDGIVLIGGLDGSSGGERYDGNTDLGEPANDGSWGPWEPNPYQPTLFGDKATTWTTLLGGFAESGLQYFATAKDSTGRIWIVENLGYPGDGTGNVAGYLDPGAVEPVRVADLQTGPSLEGFSACCDRSGRLYVAGPDDGSAKFWRYTPGPRVGAGVHEIQRVQIDPLDAPLFIIPPAILNLDNEPIDPTENLAQTQAHCDHNLGSGVVVIGGTDGSDHTVTWVALGARSLLVPSLIDPSIVISSVQHGTGYPTTDTWEQLADLPTGVFRGVLISDDANRIYYIGGVLGITSVGTVYRYDTGAWTQLADLPDGLVTASQINTTGESQPGFLVDSRLVVFAYTPDSLRCAIVSFDLKNERWGQPIYTEVNHQRGGFTLTDTNAIIIGGTDDAGNPTSAVERLRIADLAAFGGLHLASLSWQGKA